MPDAKEIEKSFAEYNREWESGREDRIRKARNIFSHVRPCRSKAAATARPPARKGRQA